MSLQQLKQEVFEANLDLVRKDLVISTWGNVSGYDPDSDLMVIKASGVPYDVMNLDDMVLVNMDGQVVEGNKRPSTDTPTHLALYKEFGASGIRGIVHTHSQYATMWAQLGKPIPCYGTTHGDYYFGSIPCTRRMTESEVNFEYEKNTGSVIIEAMNNTDCIHMSAVLVRSHGPFVWGKNPDEAVLHSQVLEYIAKMAMFNQFVDSQLQELDPLLANKHYNRKFGPGAYYGQN